MQERAKRILEVLTQDPVGNFFIISAVVAARMGAYPLACGLLGGGICHIAHIGRLQSRKEKLLTIAQNHPNWLDKLDQMHQQLETGDPSDRYVAWLYWNVREKVIGEGRVN